MAKSECAWLAIRGMTLFVLVIACVFGYLKTNCCMRKRVFAWILTSRNVTEMSPFLLEVVCPSIASGYDAVAASQTSPIVVADVGTGAGASIICHAQQKHRLRKLFLVEPNDELIPELNRVVNFFQFPEGVVEIVNGGGESASSSVSDGSADLVTTVHLLCSVNVNVLSEVTRTIHRMLRSGGVYVGIDHTKTRLGADELKIPGPVPMFPFSNPSFMRTMQAFVEPFWEVIGNGCKFVDMPTLYQENFSEEKGYTSDSPALKEFRYPVMKLVPLVWDHVVGVSRKI